MEVLSGRRIRELGVGQARDLRVDQPAELGVEEGHHKLATRLKMAVDVAKCIALSLGRHQVLKAATGNEDQSEPPFERYRAHLSFVQRKAPWRGYASGQLLARHIQHRGREIDPRDIEPRVGERKRDLSGDNRKLKDWPALGSGTIELECNPRQVLRIDQIIGRDTRPALVVLQGIASHRGAHAAPSPKASRRARSMISRMRRIDESRPEKIASPIRKCPMLSSITSGKAATGATVSKVRP